MKYARAMVAYRRSDFTCQKCGCTIPLARRRGKQREFNHIKDLWCYTCKETTKHIERRDGDYEIFDDHVL